MGSKQSSVDFILDQIAQAGEVSARKMFGEYGIYCNSKVVALFCDEQLFVKPTESGKAFIGNFSEGFPYPGAKPWLLVSGENWDDAEWLSKLIRITANALPVPKEKKKKVKPPKKR